MSVPENKRTESKMEVFIKVEELVAYTVAIISNKKVFKPEFEDYITKRINDSALLIYMYAWNANNIVVKTHDDWIERRKRQRLAISETYTLLGYMHIARRVFHLKTKRITYWNNKVILARSLLQKWCESDTKRYKDV